MIQAAEMQNALGSVLGSLPGETLVYGGHEYALEVDIEKKIHSRFYCGYLSLIDDIFIIRKGLFLLLYSDCVL